MGKLPFDDRNKEDCQYIVSQIHSPLIVRENTCTLLLQHIFLEIYGIHPNKKEISNSSQFESLTETMYSLSHLMVSEAPELS